MASSPTQGRSTSVDPNLYSPSRPGLNSTNQPSSSPTSTIASIPSRMPSRITPPMGAVAPQQKRLVIRSDPTLVTCFDPADKPLYDLWAPR